MSLADITVRTAEMRNPSSVKLLCEFEAISYSRIETIGGAVGAVCAEIRAGRKRRRKQESRVIAE